MTTTMATPSASAPAAAAADPPQSRGIDVRDALSILSLRARAGGDAGGAITDPASVPEELRGMGQSIDVVGAPQRTGADADGGGSDAVGQCTCGGSGEEKKSASPDDDEGATEDDDGHDAMRRERARRSGEIRERLASMGVAELLGAVFRAQEERVASYRDYDGGLRTILASGNMTSYPALCAKATASFSVLSDTINAARTMLEERHGREDAAAAVVRLQKWEGEKLRLTAAMHLERLRLRNARLEADAVSGDENVDRTAGLLEGGVRDLESKIARAVASINEELEELRCIAADESG